MLLCALPLLAEPPAAHGSIVYPGLLDIAIPLNLDGIYVNPYTGATSTTLPADWNTAPWLNPFFGGVYLGNDALLRPVITGVDQVVNVAFNALIDGTGNFVADESRYSSLMLPLACLRLLKMSCVR